MTGCERHLDAFDPACADCALDVELRALPMVEPPADLAANVVAAIAGDDAALEARLRSVPAVEPPADLGARVAAAVWDAEIDAALHATPMLEPPIDLAAAVLDELAYEDRLRRGAVWRAGGIALSAAAAGMLLLTDPAGFSSAGAAFFDRAAAYVPGPEQLGPVARLGDFTASAEPGLADHVVTAFDSAQLALAGGLSADSATAWFGAGGLWWMVLAVVGLVALNGVVAKVVLRRA
ncbi:MAG: hypothetical protein ACYTGX_06115 [Planctomycetota bacterium]|jgi:hypothetical protein